MIDADTLKNLLCLQEAYREAKMHVARDLCHGHNINFREAELLIEKEMAVYALMDMYSKADQKRHKLNYQAI